MDWAVIQVPESRHIHTFQRRQKGRILINTVILRWCYWNTVAPKASQVQGSPVGIQDRKHYNVAEDVSRAKQNLC